MPPTIGSAKNKAKKKLQDLMRLPKTRPSRFSAMLSVMSATAMSWGVEVFDDDKLKEAAIQEATNIGLLAALLLTISAGPMLNEAPGFIGDIGWRMDVWFAAWFLSTLFLGFATIVAVMQTVVFSTLTGDELRYFHENAGMMMHAPLLLFLNGALLLVAAVCFALYYAVSFGVWLGVLIVGFSLLFLLMFIVVEMSLLSYDCYAATQKKEEQDQAQQPGQSVVQPYGPGQVPLQPTVEYVGNTAMYVNNPGIATVPAYSMG